MTKQKPLEINESESIHAQDDALVHGFGERTEGVRVSNSQSISSDIGEGGEISNRVEGRSPCGSDKSHEIEVCRILIERLNCDGARWSAPEKVEQDSDIDCVSRYGDRVLNMQVVSAPVDPEFRRSLAEHGTVETTSNVDEAVDSLWSAIEHKANRKYAERQKNELVLVLNAMESPSLAFKQVVKSFWERRSTDAAKAGFRGIWIVGPFRDLVARLDLPS
jgi:hypothetical protein